MKASTNAKKDFQPFTLAIEVETQREAEWLWGLFNANASDATKFVNDHNDKYDKFHNSFSNYEIWEAIDKSINPKQWPHS